MRFITIIDQSLAGGKRAWNLETRVETITLRELIRQRVYQEVTEHNARHSEYFQGLVQPTDAERTLNGFKVRPEKRIDWEAQFEQALAVFDRRGFIVLVDDRQVDSLDTPVTLRSGSEVTFLRLTPLVGG